MPPGLAWLKIAERRNAGAIYLTPLDAAPEPRNLSLKNPNLMGAKHVADITRAVIAGAGGRISKKAEQTLTDGEVIEQV